MRESVDTIVIGAGQAGLCASHYLAKAGREHLVLEKDRIGERWRTGVWDSFTLVTPNWTVKLPDHPYEGDDPDGFMHKDELIDHLERFAHKVDPPLRTGVEVTSVRRSDGPGRFELATSDGTLAARNVIVATSNFRRPKLPEAASRVPEGIAQLHASEYRNPDALPSGAVLVVGSGQSGTQIADELAQHGERRTFLSVGGAPRFPRRYRGRDLFWWADRLGLLDQTVDDLDSPADRFAPNPQATGRDGGRTMNLHGLARDGVELLGRFEGVEGGTLRFAPDLHERLARIDEGAEKLERDLDTAVEKMGLDLPEASEDEDPTLRHGYDAPVRTALDPEAEGIATIVWATGYDHDFSWVEPLPLDEWDYPVSRRGVTDVPGLYLLGLHWLHTRRSSLLSGVAADAEHVVGELVARD